MLAYHDLLMPPTYLDEYRRKKADQRRSQQSTGNVPPNADSTLTNDQAGAPADGVRPVRYVASRLTGFVDDQAPIGPDEPSDPYMDALIDDAHRGAQDESNGTSQTAGVASPHPDAGSSEASIPDDEFFDRQANSAPQPQGQPAPPRAAPRSSPQQGANATAAPASERPPRIARPTTSCSRGRRGQTRSNASVEPRLWPRWRDSASCC